MDQGTPLSEKEIQAINDKEAEEARMKAAEYADKPGKMRQKNRKLEKSITKSKRENQESTSVKRGPQSDDESVASLPENSEVVKKSTERSEQIVKNQIKNKEGNESKPKALETVRTEFQMFTFDSLGHARPNEIAALKE